MGSCFFHSKGTDEDIFTQSYYEIPGRHGFKTTL
ncbi:hypothetical protein SRABI134_02797 [Peribacillus sp. Bi134]|nr:hypothetical protein SRABI134_02797 [Peribacillus sp. Bi134]